MSFLDTLTHVDADKGGAVSIGGHRLTDSETRQRNRWRAGASPSLFTADRWMVAAAVHINSYFAFAKRKGLAAWAVREPWFEVQELSARDWAEIAAASPLPDGIEDLTQLCGALAA
jgi:hypothetical protein